MANDPITLRHSASGASCVIYPFGAHLTSFKTGSGRELLFLSRDAKLDGTRAIRGGIPLCFPQFGQLDKGMPQHGFLRNNYWREVEGSRVDGEHSAGVSLEIELKDAKNARGGRWDADTKLDAKCTYSVKIDADGFAAKIEMENTGSEPWDFQVLLHNYFLVHGGAALDRKLCNVRGLEGYVVSDKVSGGDDYVLGPDPVTIPETTIIDRVYSPPDGKTELNLAVSAGASNELTLRATGEVNGVPMPVSGVVWNPHAEKARAMSDFGDGQHVDMICVEPGLLQGTPPLKGGERASFAQWVKAR